MATQHNLQYVQIDPATHPNDGIHYILHRGVWFHLGDVIYYIGEWSMSQMLSEFHDGFKGNPLYAEINEADSIALPDNLDTAVFKVGKFVTRLINGKSQNNYFINPMLLYWIFHKRLLGKDFGMLTTPAYGFPRRMYRDIIPKILATGGSIEYPNLSDQVTRTAFTNSFTPPLSDEGVKHLLENLGASR